VCKSLTLRRSRALSTQLILFRLSPMRRISELVPLEESAQPTFIIMRRGPADRRVRQNSQPGSVTGEDGDISDAEPSEAGSSGGRSNPAGSKRHLTIEEREAAYNEARSRIFMGFEEKEKDKDSSANSSTFSLASGSSSTSRGSTGEIDDSASSAATESEWSGPVTRDKREGRRGGGSAGSSSRSVRSYHASGSNSSRHSRAASPSSYATLYDPAAGTFDPAFGPQGPPHGYIQYYYGYPPPGHGPPPPFIPPYGYGYPPYGYPPPPQPSAHPHSDPVTPGEPLYPHAQSPPAMQPYPPNPYLWQPPSAPSSHQASKATSPSSVNSVLPMTLPPQQPETSPASQPMQPHNVGYPGYYSPHYPPYGMPGYFPQPYTVPPGQIPPAPPQVPGQYYPEPAYGIEYPGNGSIPGRSSLEDSRTSSRNSNSHGLTNGDSKTAGPARRQPWGYGPGIGMGGSPGADFVGPRLNSRRTSSGSQSAGYRTPGDEASSVTVSA
jgi:hypothetical protein